MIHLSSIEYAVDGTEAGRQIAQLLHVLALAEAIAGQSPSFDALAEAARIGSAYEEAPHIAQRRFDAFVEETAAWASAGVNAVIGVSDRPHRPHAAARRLAEELARAISKLGQMVA